MHKVLYQLATSENGTPEEKVTKCPRRIDDNTAGVSRGMSILIKEARNAHPGLIPLGGARIGISAVAEPEDILRFEVRKFGDVEVPRGDHLATCWCGTTMASMEAIDLWIERMTRTWDHDLPPSGSFFPWLLVQYRDVADEPYGVLDELGRVIRSIAWSWIDSREEALDES